ncbi:MAG: hypothetical protein C4527_27040 [Candidatus Omnitrophota bacterium]|jgi:putative inorganic carbon (HCO3(-)) transporter|nr:MAG: hypothetical protein C4527_27040 [Candidatus Omnitrophota bacterium]
MIFSKDSLPRLLDLVLRVGILSLCLLVPLAYFPQARSIPEHAKISVLGFLLSLLIACCWSREGKKTAGWDRATLILFLISIFFLSISTLLSVNWPRSLFGVHYRYNGLILLSAYALLAFLTSIITRIDRKLPLFILHTIAFVAVIASVIGFLQYCGIGGEIIGKTVLRVRPHGAFSFVNLYAGFMAFSIPLILAAGMRERRWLVVGLISFGLLFAVFGIRAASSRGAWLGCLAGCVLVAGWLLLNASTSLERKYRALRLHWFLITAMLPVVFFPPERYVRPLHSVVQDKIVSEDLNNFLQLSTADRLSSSLDQKDTTRTTRVYLWKSALTIFREYPFFGAGPDTFSYFYQQYRPVEDVRVYGDDAVAHDAHNLLLHNLAMWGFLPTLAWLALLGRVLYVLMKRVWKRTQEQREIVVVLAIVFVVDHGSQLLNVNSISLHMISWILLGVMIGWGLQPPSPVGNQSNIMRKTRYIGAGILGLVLPVFAIIPLFAESVFVSGAEAIAKQQDLKGIALYQRAVSLFPFREEYWERLCIARLAYGIARQDKKILQQSLSCVNEMVQRFPLQSRFYTLRGRIRMVLASPSDDRAMMEKAFQDFQRACELHPVQPKYHAYYAQAAVRLKQYEIAKQELEQAVRLGDERERAFYQAMLADLPSSASFPLDEMD